MQEIMHNLVMEFVCESSKVYNLELIFGGQDKDKIQEEEV